MNLEDIKNIGVVGAGTMGHGIALNFALAGYPVTISDISYNLLRRALDNVNAALKLFQEEDLTTAEQAEAAIALIQPTTSLEEVAASDFITEAIVERAETKRELFNKLDEICPEHTILASNTSWMIVRDFAKEVKRQDKVIITHYFAPPHIVPGVEVAGGPGTSKETIDITCALMEKIGKVPVRVLKESQGAIINRLQDVMRREANIIWAEGIATAEDIEKGIITTCGFRMPHEGSLMHFDLAGMWKWPQDVLDAYAWKEADENSGLSRENVKKIRKRYASGKPWFIDPDKFDEAVEKPDRELARRLKALYRNG